MITKTLHLDCRFAKDVLIQLSWKNETVLLSTIHRMSCNRTCDIVVPNVDQLSVVFTGRLS